MNYSSGAGGYLEFITPNKNLFEQEFSAYHATTSGWEKLESMANYNKFGIAAADLKGKWTNDFSGSLSYVNAYTGAAAGTDTHASIQNFSFETGNTYRWDLGVASGAVGNIKFQGVKSSARFSAVFGRQHFQISKANPGPLVHIFPALRERGSYGSTARLLESSNKGC